MVTPIPIVAAVQKKLPRDRDLLCLTAQELKALKIANTRLYNQVRLTYITPEVWSTFEDKFVCLSLCTFKWFTADYKKKFRGTRVWHNGKLSCTGKSSDCQITQDFTTAHIDYLNG